MNAERLLLFTGCLHAIFRGKVSWRCAELHGERVPSVVRMEPFPPGDGVIGRVVPAQDGRDPGLCVEGQAGELGGRDRREGRTGAGGPRGMDQAHLLEAQGQSKSRGEAKPPSCVRQFPCGQGATPSRTKRARRTIRTASRFLRSGLRRRRLPRPRRARWPRPTRRRPSPAKTAASAPSALTTCSTCAG